MSDKKNTKLFCLALSALFAIAALAAVIYYIICPAQGYFHSDCTDSLYWAEAAAESGKVFNPDFFYAGLLPFSAQLWLVPLIHIFGVTMAVHTAGMVIFALLFFASVIFFCRSMEWSYSFSFFTAGLVLLLLSSSDKMREIMWGHVIYYSLGLLILFTGMGLMLRTCRQLEKGNRKKGFIYAAVFLVFMTFAATNGLQCLAIYTLPMFVSLAALVIFNSKDKIISENNIRYLFSAVLLTVSAAVGLLLLLSWQGDIIARYANGFSMLDGVGDWAENMMQFPEKYFTLFGVEIEDGAIVGEVQTLCMLLKFAASLIVLALPLVLLFCYKKIEDVPTKLLLWVHLAVSAVIMVGFICGRLAEGNWRLLPMVGTGILASLAAVRFMFHQKENALSWRRVGALLALFPVLCSFVNFVEICAMPANYGRDNEHHQLAAFLEENGLEYGFAEFWTAQATTVIADSEVKVRPVEFSYENGAAPYTYQVNKKWYSESGYAEEYFFAMKPYEYNAVAGSEMWQELVAGHFVAEYECGDYIIFVFDVNPFQGLEIVETE